MCRAAAPERMGSAELRPPRPWSSTRRGGTRRRPAASPPAVSGRPGHGTPRGIAQQRGELHRLAGAVDAALGIEERIQPAGGARPFTPRSVRSKAAMAEIEEAVIAAGVRRHDEAGRQSALAAREAGIERDMPVGIGLASSRAPRCCGRQGGFRRRRSAAALASERTKTCTPSSPEKAVRPRSETTNHWVACSA